jgi:putative heme-binding domain-containing protein
MATRRVLLGALVSTPALADRLVEAVNIGTVPASEIDPATREGLRRLGDRRLRARADAVLLAPPSDDRRAVVRKYETALTLEADPSRGRALFARHCQTCHARGGQGAKVGPDLNSVAGRPKADLLASILDPGREVAPDGMGVVVVTTGGQTLTGLLAEETLTAVRLRRAEGLEDVVPRGEVEALRPTRKSLMPDGLEQLLSPQDVADLISFLRAPDPER